MLLVAVLIYFSPTIVALSRGHFSALTIFLLNLFLGWTLIGWLVAFIWSCTGNTAANYDRLGADVVDPSGRIPPRRSAGSLWLILVLILVVIILLDKQRGFRDVRSFEFTFPSRAALVRQSALKIGQCLSLKSEGLDARSRGPDLPAMLGGKHAAVANMTPNDDEHINVKLAEAQEFLEGVGRRQSAYRQSF